MNVTFLGTGTSTGVPVIGCHCKVCKSPDPKNKRLRQSALISQDDYSLLIDASIDLREQCLKFNIEKIDAILLTHSHADHILGLDETRIFCYLQKKAIKLFGSRETLQGIRRSLWYCFEDGVPVGGGLPNFELMEVDGKFKEGPFEITPLDGDHGFQKVTGYKINNLCYMTDYKYVPHKTIDVAKNCQILAINALRESPPHPTHLTVGEALSIIRQIQPKKSFLIHLGHSIDYDEISKKLPDGIELAYDGLKINL
jgi:phosphoribosyl 1,2-cyclic phosphate phosphodiesterase